MLVRNGSLLVIRAIPELVFGDLMIFQYHFGAWIPPASNVMGICCPLTCGKVMTSWQPLNINTSSCNRPAMLRAAPSTVNQFPALTTFEEFQLRSSYCRNNLGICTNLPLRGYINVEIGSPLPRAEDTISIGRKMATWHIRTRGDESICLRLWTQQHSKTSSLRSRSVRGSWTDMRCSSSYLERWTIGLLDSI